MFNGSVELIILSVLSQLDQAKKYNLKPKKGYEKQAQENI